MARFLLLPLIFAGSVQDGGNSTMQGGTPNFEPDMQGVPEGDGDSSSEDLEMLRQVE